MKICLYTGSALPKLGGQEAVVDSLARHFQQLGHEPIVMAPHPRRPLRAVDSTLPYPVIRHPRFISTRRFVGWYRRFLLAAHRRHRFDVVHCHDAYPTGYVASLCKSQMGIPLVITSHGGDVRAGNVRLVKPGMRPRFLQAIAAADALVSIGQFTGEGFLQLGADPSKIHDIPNGVDLKPFESMADRPAELDASIIPEKYMLFLGRLAHRKGIDVLLRALAMLSPAGGVELVIAGSGEEQANLEKLIAELQLQSRVLLAGRVTGNSKTWLLQNAMCLVVPSRGWEAFPLVVLEAYAAERPVIGSRIAGLEDVVGTGGILVAPESPEQWAAALQKTREDLDWRKSASLAAKALAADHSWEKIANRHLQLYQHIKR